MTLLGGLVRLALLPLKVALAVVEVVFRAGLALGALPARLSWSVTRRAGWKGAACFVGGLGVGLLVAPTSGRSLRRRLVQLAGGGQPDDPALVTAVSAELASSSRTWHLPQPAVRAVDGIVILDGDVPHDVGRAAMVAAAEAVPGVRGVRDELRVEDGAAAVDR